tara:strand:- start:1456 stop:1947 length:492 start_codon:yes stop_codon:yes gene_type:complete
MSFFTNEQLEQSETMEMGGSIEPIPEKTQLKAIIGDAKWDTNQDATERFISTRWDVLAPEEFGNRKIFQKIKVLDSDPKKADRQKRMLVAIDKNAGGELVKLGREPQDEDLQKALCNKTMLIRVMIWEMDGKSGNWVSQVAPDGQLEEASPSVKQDDTDEIPF